MSQRQDGLAVCRVFSYERDAGKGRAFIVTTIPQFWRRYRRMPPAQRHHYEVIREGWPCHLYFGAHMLPSSAVDAHFDEVECEWHTLR